MSTSPGRPNPTDAKPLSPDPTGQDPSAKDPTAEEKMLLQAAIFEVTRDAGGKSLPGIRDMLRSEFSRRGVQAPTPMWLDAVASAAFYGEPYIIDLPAALAAEGEVPAPNHEVRERLAGRRELREEKLPPGTFPPPSAWELDDSEVTGGPVTAGTLPDGGTRAWKVLSAAAFAAAALLAILAIRIRAVRARPRSTGRSTAGGA